MVRYLATAIPLRLRRLTGLICLLWLCGPLVAWTQVQDTFGNWGDDTPQVESHPLLPTRPAEERGKHRFGLLNTPSGSARPHIFVRGTERPIQRTPLANRCGRADWVVYAFSYSVSQSVWQNYQFDLLSHMAVSGYTINTKTGGPMSHGNWVPSAMRDSAHQNGCKVHLTVTTIGSNGSTYSMLSNPTASAACIDSIRHYVKAYEADGVCLDFEDMTQGADAPLFLDWTTKLRKALQQDNPGAEIAIAGPIILRSDSIYTQRALYDVIDFNVVMGYDFTGSFSGPGCTSPLPGTSTFGGWNLMAGLDTYLKRGVKASQLVLALPYYGYTWNTAGTSVGSTSEGYVGTVTYDHIMNGYPDNGYDRKWDPASLSTYYIQTVNGQIRQTWLLDSLSLAMRYDSVIARGLAGIGIWELSYGSTSSDLWDLLNIKFGQCSQEAAPPSAATWLTDHSPDLGWGIGASLLVLVLVVLSSRKAREELLNRHWIFPLAIFLGLNGVVLVQSLFFPQVQHSWTGIFLWSLLLAAVSLVVGYLFGRRKHLF